MSSDAAACFILWLQTLFFVKCFGSSDRSSIFALAIGNPVPEFTQRVSF